MLFKFLSTILFLNGLLAQTSTCPPVKKFGTGPPSECEPPTDPNNKPNSGVETLITEHVFNDLFPQANLGWGPNKCSPYSYEAFVIAARYFPRFGTESGKNYSADQNIRRDVAAFFAHAIQETGSNDISVYNGGRSQKEADNCFYRGGFYNWFEGGPQSPFLPSETAGTNITDGNECVSDGRYCKSDPLLDYFFPCGNGTSGNNFKSCYFGRGPIQLSYNFNYGRFQKWLESENIHVDLLNNPNLLMTHTSPPLAIMASLWFYMTPQPPKPAMHDIVIGNWNAGPQNSAAGYSGAIFGPTSLIINKECTGEDQTVPGGPGENRRIKAFRWFTSYFNVQPGADNTLSCKNMPQKFNEMEYKISYQPNYSLTWKTGVPCQCVPANYEGMVPYFDSEHYPTEFVEKNAANAIWCQRSIYEAPQIYKLRNDTDLCLNTPMQ